MMRNISLKKSVFLMSLALLSPKIFAVPTAQEININYNRFDASSLDPHLSLLAKACHTLSDPLDIDIDLIPQMLTDHSIVQLIITSVPQRNGYAGLSAQKKSNLADLDPDFLVPWSVMSEGNALINYTNDVTEKGRFIYSNRFCFSSDKHRGALLLNELDRYNGYVPIAENPDDNHYSNIDKNNDFNTYCKGKKTEPESEGLDGSYTYIENGSQPRRSSVPDDIQNLIWSKPFEEYQGKYVFYNKRYYDSNADVIKPNTAQSINLTSDSTQIQKKELNNGSIETTYTLPIKPTDSGAKNSILQSGHFHLNLSHRNISSLELRITHRVPNYDDTVSSFIWQRDTSDLNNTLSYNGLSGYNALFAAGNITDDPYLPFYGDGVAKNYFRGTLVAKTSLNSTYTSVNKSTPLSLPVNKSGDINLVNTQRLKFQIGNDQNQGGIGGNTIVTVYGQPMKFGSLYAGNKEVASAMQVRNACY